MRTIYIDEQYHCHVTDDGTMTAVKTGFFDGKCDAFVEGYRLVPEGESWTRSDGAVFTGEMIAPWRNYAALDAVQRIYEQALIADMQQALNTVGVTLDA